MKEIATHSPGPWKLTYYEGAFDHKITDTNDDLLLDGDEFLTSVPVEKGDWLLIAAAPELVEVTSQTLKLLASMDRALSPFEQNLLIEAREAIKKAKGE